MPNAYVPAFVRAYPFIFLDDVVTGARAVGIEADAECLSSERGQKLFEDGQPTAMLTEAISFCECCRTSLEEARSFGEAMDRPGCWRRETPRSRFRSAALRELPGSAQSTRAE